MKLFLSGQKGSPHERPLSPTGRKVKAILDASKDGELFTSQQLAELAGTTRQTVQELVVLASYRHRVKACLYYWGKPTTIEQLKKETA